MSTEKKDDSKKSLEELWTTVRKNSSDFNAWTALLGHVEQNVLLVGECSQIIAIDKYFKPKFVSICSSAFNLTCATPFEILLLLYLPSVFFFAHL